ncbi:hypothetical protein ACNO1C_005878, partial [Escherichia coli]
ALFNCEGSLLNLDTRASLRLSAFSSLISSLAVANVLSPFLIFSMALSSLSEDVAPRKLFSTTIFYF